jgi:hypothetical protein
MVRPLARRSAYACQRRLAEFLARPVPELLSERSQLLSVEGREAVGRVLQAVQFSDRLRSQQPTAALGTRLEQVWLRLGGAQCVDAAARVNLDLLWRSLDGLPEGEPDLLGFALDAALDKLTAVPDPEADSDCGVQLMTIHKAKGLEFEIVIVPDLQAGAGGSKRELLSWLERGLPPDAEAADPQTPARSRNFSSRRSSGRAPSAAKPSGGSIASAATANPRRRAVFFMSPPRAPARNFISSRGQHGKLRRTARSPSPSRAKVCF